MLRNRAIRTKPPPVFRARGSRGAPTPARRQQERALDPGRRRALEGEADRLASRIVADLPLRRAGVGRRGRDLALPEDLRSSMEGAFGRSFARVRLHHDPVSDAAARQRGAVAFTRGPDIHFAAGRYHPEQPAGRRLIAHELVHVAQQGSAPGRGSQGPSLGAAPAGAVQHQDQAPGPPPSGLSLSEPDLGSINFRIRLDGQIEILPGLPSAPVAGSLSLGARRLPDGSWEPVVGRNVTPIGSDTYDWEELLDLIGGIAGGSGPGSSPAPFPGLPGLRGPTVPGLPPLPSGPVPGAPGLAPAPSLTMPSFDVSRTRLETLAGFTSGSAALDETHRRTIDSLAMRIFIDDPVLVIVEGHTDAIGEADDNQGLGRSRAEAVAEALRDAGVRVEIQVETAGESEPAVEPAEDSADRSANRRVTVFWMARNRPALGNSDSPPRFQLDLDRDE